MGDATGLVLGLVAAAMWGTLDVLVAFAGRRIGGVASAALVVGSSCLIILAVAVLTGTGLPSDPRMLGLALLAGSVSSIGFACFYTALRLGPVSVVSPTVAVYGGLASVLAIVFLGERPATIQLAGAAAATVGIALAGLSFTGGGRPRFSGPGVPFALVSLVAWSVSIVLLSVPIREAGWLSASSAARIANASLLVGLWLVVRARGATRPGEPALAPEPEPPIDVAALTAGGGSGTSVAASAGAPGRGAALAALLRRHPVELMLVAGVLETLGFVAFSYALGVAPAWLVSLASSLGPTVTVTAGVILFAERPRRVQWAGIALVFAGVALVAVG